MDLTPYLEAIRADLESVAGSDEATEAVTERLVRALAPSLQLCMLDALGQAAQELNAQIPSGRIDVRLAGRDVHLVLAGDEPRADSPSDDYGGGRTARITLRVPEAIKTRVEQEANREGLSTNTWLARAVKRELGQQQQQRRGGGSRIQGMARN